jgi:hypothetical protein
MAAAVTRMAMAATPLIEKKAAGHSGWTRGDDFTGGKIE